MRGKIKEKIVYMLLILLMVVFAAIEKKEVYGVVSDNDDKMTIEEGSYIIRTKINKNYAVDINNSSLDNGANVQLFEDTSGLNQRFNVIYEGEGYYTIESELSKKVLDVACGGKTNGTNVQQYESNGTPAQKWLINKNADGSYSIVSKLNDKLCLDVSCGIAENNSNIQLYTCNDTNAQKFVFEKVENIIGEQVIEDGSYILKTKLNTNYVIDIDGNENCSNAQIYEDTSGFNQRFNLKYVGDGYYEIQAMHSNKVLDVACGGKEKGSNVWQYKQNGTDAQKWIIKKENNNYTFISALNKKLCIDVSCGMATNGNNIQVYTINNSNAQKFELEKVVEYDKEQTIEDGSYIIKTGLNNNMAIDISGISKDNGANVQIYENNFGMHQRFYIEYIGNGYYTIKARHSNKVLDIACGGKTNGSNVWQYDSNDTIAQKWIIRKNGDYYNIIAAGNERLCLDISCGTAYNGNNVQVYKNNNTLAQKFTLEKVEIDDGYYAIKSAIDEEFVLDVADSSRLDEANIQIYKNSLGKNQRFNVTYLGNGCYSIIADHSEKSLDVSCGSKVAGANVQQYSSNNTDAQKWIIKKTDDNYYNIITKLNETLCLDIVSGIATNGNNVQIYTSNGTPAQKFKFEKIITYKNLDENKYPGYREKIEYLATKYPNWKFELLGTGLDWNDVIANEMDGTKNVVSITNQGTEWARVNGITIESGTWIQASEEANKYYMDPRNMINEDYVFQFEDLLFNSKTQVIAGVQSIISDIAYMKGNNVSYVDNNGNTQTLNKSYAQIIMESAETAGISPYHLASRIKQEQGANVSVEDRPLISGTVEDYVGYYNYLNINATGKTTSSVILNGLIYAKNKGWTNPEISIREGAKFIASSYIQKGQNTLYLQKFDVDKTGGLYSHQYMQNISAALTESIGVKNTYTSMGLLGEEKNFIIPLYENMPVQRSEMPGYGEYMEITQDSVNVRSINDTNSIIATVNMGDIAMRIEKDAVLFGDNLLSRVYINNKDGYIASKYLRNISFSKKSLGRYVTKSSVNVRTAPSVSNSRIVLTLSRGQIVNVNELNAWNNDGYKWSRVTLADDRQVYIATTYLEAEN